MIWNQDVLRRPSDKLWPLKLAYRQAWLDIGGSVQDSILVAGVGRSGTTWLSEVLAASTKSREIFEPFIVRADGNFALSPTNRADSTVGYRPNYSLFIPPGVGRASAHYAEAGSILEGRIRSWWTEQGMAPGIYKRRVIKDIRANLMLGWLSDCWPDLKIIYVVRNPISTVASMLERSSSGWGFDWDPKFVLEQEELMDGCLAPFRKILEVEHDHDARLMLRWCVENYVAFNQLAGNTNVMVVSYDVLSKNPLLWEGIFEFIDWPFNEDRFAARVNQQSKTTVTGKGVELKKFHSGNERIASLIKLVDQFGLNEYL